MEVDITMANRDKVTALHHSTGFSSPRQTLTKFQAVKIDCNEKPLGGITVVMNRRRWISETAADTI